MISLGGERPTADRMTRPSKPVNLTAAAEALPWLEACNLVGIGGPSEAAALDVRGLAYAENGCRNDGSCEVLYVIIAGYAMLRSDDFDMECTEGDVLFIPRGCPHRFERLGGEIKIWRILPKAP